MLDLRKQPLIGALRRIGRFIVAKLALHPVDPFLCLDAVTLPEQAGQARMAYRDVEMVRIIIRNRLPVEVARSKCDPADRTQFLEPV